ncbi:Myosin-m heavy chain, partial [Globisporangium splendens]
MNGMGMHVGMQMSRADARQFSGKAAEDGRVAAHALPLPKRFFPKLRLSSAMVREYQLTAQKLLDDALDQLRRERIVGGVDESWRDIGASTGFKRFTKTEGDVQHYRVQGLVRASLAGLMNVVFADNDRRLRERRKALYNDSLDAQTLCVLKERSADNLSEHMALRWLAVELSNSSDANKRDMCMLEFTGTTLDREGQQIGFKILHSVQVPECKSLKKTYGLLRLVGTDVLLLRPVSDNGHTDVILNGSFDTASTVSSWLLTSYLGNIAGALSKLPVVVQERCLANMPMLDKRFWVPVNERKVCNVCVSKFGYLSKKHHCRSCGEITCKSCIVTRSVGEDSKFCKKCIIIAMNQEDQSFGLALESSLSDGTSSSIGASRLSISSTASSTISSSTSRAKAFKPTQPSINKFHVDMKLLDDLHETGGSSLTASEESYGSTASTLIMDGSMWSSSVSSLDEDHVVVLDTQDMRKHSSNNLNNASSNGYGSSSASSGYTSSRSNYFAGANTSSYASTPSHYSSSRGMVATPPPPAPQSFQNVENSIAHQRQLLEKMMSTARGYKTSTSYH